MTDQMQDHRLPEESEPQQTPVGDLEPPAPATVALVEPADGVPAVLVTQRELQDYAAALAAGQGPVAVDAERASGFRYGQRAYLVQIRRQGAGTALIDPIHLPDLSILTQALRGVEWILHAASQDLACLAEVNFVPDLLFDTELAGRILGRERVGLGAIVAAELGLSLAKEHSAADWSTRPLPHDWLRYAALDVEVLVELRDALAADLHRQGKWEWAQQEFEAVRLAPPPAPRIDPWRRTSAITTVRDPRRLAVVRELWYARDAVAQERDIAPGRVLNDRAIIAAALALPRDRAALGALQEFQGKGTRRRIAQWWEAVAKAKALPDGELPARRIPSTESTPPARVWAEKFPEAAARLRAVRATMRHLSRELSTPQENLLSPENQRRISWEPPAPATAESVGQLLSDFGARPWQIEVSAAAITAAILDPSSVPEDGQG